MDESSESRVSDKSLSVELGTGDSLWFSLGYGAVGFAGVSLAAFSVWAFGGKLFVGRGGEPAMYAVIAMVFMGLSGLILRRLTPGPGSLWRFYRAFVPAFLGYAIVWSGFWFSMGSGWGEWLGALAGCGVLAWVVNRHLGAKGNVWRAGLVCFVLHMAGYWVGGWSMGELIGVARRDEPGGWTKGDWLVIAKLSWGLFYGLGLGAGLGYLFFTSRLNGGDFRRSA